MATWPASLPLPLRSNYSLQPESGTIRTDMEAGPARSRSRYSAAPTKIPVNWRFTEAEFAVFEAWWANSISQGAAWFQCGLSNGLGVNTVDARFVSAYQASLVAGNVWDVSGTLEVRSLPAMTAAELEVATAYPPNDIVYASPRLHYLINTNMPAYW